MTAIAIAVEGVRKRFGTWRNLIGYTRIPAPLFFATLQTVLVGGVGTAIGLADDAGKGLIERFRSLPMACSAVLAFSFSFAVAWGFAALAMSAPNAETAQFMTFPIVFPLTFASSAFVPTANMPGWLQAFANNQPVTKMVDATRAAARGAHGDAGAARRAVDGRRPPGARPAGGGPVPAPRRHPVATRAGGRHPGGAWPPP